MTKQKEMVVLVDKFDNEIGTMEKMEAHEKGRLHRAFSVFIFNQKGEMLLQQRAAHKYHSPNLWTNTCCSHPRCKEGILDAGERRLKEEMGMWASLKPMFSFVYRAEFDNGLVEHEYDHVLMGKSDENPVINPAEVQDYCWKTTDEVEQWMQESPDAFTPWFKIIFKEYQQFIQAFDHE